MIMKKFSLYDNCAVWLSRRETAVVMPNRQHAQLLIVPNLLRGLGLRRCHSVVCKRLANQVGERDGLLVIGQLVEQRKQRAAGVATDADCFCHHFFPGGGSDGS